MSRMVSISALSERQLLTIVSESVFSLSALEAKLVTYISDPEASAQPFDVSSIPKISRAQAAKEVARRCFAHYLRTICLNQIPRTKHSRDSRCPEYVKGSHSTTADGCRDTVRVCSTARGCARVRDLWSCPEQQHETGPAHRERNRISSVRCQAYLQGAYCIPGT